MLSDRTPNARFRWRRGLRKAGAGGGGGTPPHQAILTPERVTTFARETHRAPNEEVLVRLAADLLRECGTTAQALIHCDLSDTQPDLTIKHQTTNWATTFGNVEQILDPRPNSPLRFLARNPLAVDRADLPLSDALLATTDVRALDARAFAQLVNAPKREQVTGHILLLPVITSDTDTLYLLAHLTHSPGRLTNGLMPLLRATVFPRADTLAGAPTSATRHWALLTPEQVLATSPDVTRTKPDLLLAHENATRHAFRGAEEDLRHLENALRLEPNPEPLTLEFTAVARGKRNTHDVPLPLDITPIRLDDDRYAFLGRLTSTTAEDLIDLGTNAIVHTTMHSLGMFLVLDRHGLIHEATESLTNHLGYDPKAVKSLSITALLDDESVQRFAQLRSTTLDRLLHAPGTQKRLHNPERIPVKLRSREGTPFDFEIELTLLREHVDGQPLLRGFVAGLYVAGSHMLLQRELTQRLRFIRHDRRSSRDAIENLVHSIESDPTLPREAVDEKLTHVLDEVNVWDQVATVHARLLETIASNDEDAHVLPRDLEVSFNKLAHEHVPRHVRFFARRRRPREQNRIDLHMSEEMSKSTVWINMPGDATLWYAIRNYSENAVKYAQPDENDRIPIHVNIRLDPAQPDHVRLEFTNRTHHLTPDRIEDVWGYRQRLTTHGGDPGGSGIGLWSTKLLVERAGGRVACELSEDGYTITFAVSYPLLTFVNHDGKRINVRGIKDGYPEPANPNEVRCLVRNALAPQDRPPRVLIVDTDEEDLSYVEYLFFTLNADVAASDDHDEAERLLREQAFDVALINHRPGEDGAESTLRAAVRRGIDTRIISDTPTAVPRALLTLAGHRDVLYKPTFDSLAASNVAYGCNQDPSHEEMGERQDEA